MNPPRVGALSNEYRAICVYAPRPGMAQCGRPATLHVRVVSEHYGHVALATCAGHAPVAMLAGSFVQQHTFEGVCGLPATVWLDEANVCTIDDSGVDPWKASQFTKAGTKQ